MIVYGGFDIEMPKVSRIKQNFCTDVIDDVRNTVLEELKQKEKEFGFKRGERIAVTVGSRGIASIDVVVKAVIDQLKEYGTEPFIIPSMGSHGGATPEGQREVLASYNITEETMGVPINDVMDTVLLGFTESKLPVYFSKPAYEADGVFVINRVKSHTNFRGTIESGLMKMLVIGLGKHKGASYFHKQGFDMFHLGIPEVGRFIMDNAPIRGGLALVENGYSQLMITKALIPKEFEANEIQLLKVAHDAMPKILFDDVDVLIVEEIGKNISGSGMDPNVTGRFGAAFMMRLNPKPCVQKIVVLGLTEETHGNACGIGSADITTQAVVEEMDKEKTYANVITAGAPKGAAIPLTMDNDYQAIALALKTCSKVEPNEAKVVRIKNTCMLSEIEISEALLPIAEKNPSIEIVSKPKSLEFTPDGKLV